MRNKIVIGHKRRDIYLANFITSAVTGIAMCAVFFLPYPLYRNSSSGVF